MQITPYAIFTEDEYRGPVCELYGGSHFHGAGVLRLNHPAEHYGFFFLLLTVSTHNPLVPCSPSLCLFLSFYRSVDWQ